MSANGAALQPSPSVRSLVPLAKAFLVAGTTTVAICYQLRPLAVIFLTGLSGIIVLGSDTGSLQHNPAVRRFAEMADNLGERFFALHADKPSTFCVAAVGVLSAVAYLGCLVSGSVLTLLAVLTVLGGLLFGHAMRASCSTTTATETPPTGANETAEQRAESCEAVTPEAAVSDVQAQSEGPLNAICEHLQNARHSFSRLRVAVVDSSKRLLEHTDDDDFARDFLPEPSADDRLVLQRAGDDASFVSRCDATTAAHDDDGSDDDLPSDLLGPLTEHMPDIDANLSSDDDDDDPAVSDLKHVTSELRRAAAAKAAPPKDAVQPAAAMLRTVSSVSSLSSSSSDDDSISRGLDFQSVRVLDGDSTDGRIAAGQPSAPAAVASSYTAAVSAGISNLLGGLIHRGIEQAIVAQTEQALGAKLTEALMVAPDTSSDDSDFEVLTHDDCRGDGARKSTV